jgi:hypothetical protein
MAFHTSSGLFKTAGQVAAEQRAKQFKGTQGWESVGVGLGRLFSGPSDAELKSQQLNTIGDDLVKDWDATHPVEDNWNSKPYLEQLIYSEDALRKKGYGEEANALYDEYLKRSKEERAIAANERAEISGWLAMDANQRAKITSDIAQAKEKRAVIKAGLPPEPHKPAQITSEAMKEVSEDINTWMDNANTTLGSYGWKDEAGAKRKIASAFTTLQSDYPMLSNSEANEILKAGVHMEDADLWSWTFGDDLVWNEESYKAKLAEYLNKKGLGVGQSQVTNTNPGGVGVAPAPNPFSK